jgi:hypothetical protein
MSSGRLSPSMIISGLSTVTLTLDPCLEMWTVLLAASYDTVAPTCSNIERMGARTVFAVTSATSTRFCSSRFGFV